MKYRCSNCNSELNLSKWVCFDETHQCPFCSCPDETIQPIPLPDRSGKTLTVTLDCEDKTCGGCRFLRATPFEDGCEFYCRVFQIDLDNMVNESDLLVYRPVVCLAACGGGK